MRRKEVADGALRPWLMEIDAASENHLQDAHRGVRKSMNGVESVPDEFQLALMTSVDGYQSLLLVAGVYSGF